MNAMMQVLQLVGSMVRPFALKPEYQELLSEAVSEAHDHRDMTTFHPRAAKLMRKRKAFIVIAHDEPYFQQAYSMIRDNEKAKGTWTDEDERVWRESWKTNAA